MQLSIVWQIHKYCHEVCHKVEPKVQPYDEPYDGMCMSLWFGVKITPVWITGVIWSESLQKLRSGQTRVIGLGRHDG